MLFCLPDQRKPLSRVVAPLALILCLCPQLSAQKRLKSWRDWTSKEVEKILNDSPWGQTQIETDTSEMVFTPTTRTGGGDSLSRREQGATNQAVNIKYRIRWLSARPIRQALVRWRELSDGKISEQLKFFAEGPSETRIVIAVTFETSDQRFGGRAMEALTSANTGVLKNNTYLELKDGKRIFLQQYVPPQQNILAAAMFIFPRFIDRQPLLTADSISVRFHSEYENKIRLDSSMNPTGQTSSPRQSSSSAVARISNESESSFKFKFDMKFKLPEMIYNGVLEY
jgi:hypothetical protein